MNICGKIFTQGLITQIQATIDTQQTISRRRLSQQVCQWMDWRDANGNWKEMSCRVALLKLHRAGHITLPPAGTTPPRIPRQQNKEEGIEEIPAIECQLSGLGHIELIRIRRGDKKKSRLWNGLMNRYHYLGPGPLCGAQIRYLIYSEPYGFLGGLSFSAAAWRLEARDHWIGWNESTRRQHLSKVVNNSRFLIVPQVKVKNLASYVLSLAARHLVADWLELLRY